MKWFQECLIMHLPTENPINGRIIASRLNCMLSLWWNWRTWFQKPYIDSIQYLFSCRELCANFTESNITVSGFYLNNGWPYEGHVLHRGRPLKQRTWIISMCGIWGDIHRTDTCAIPWNRHMRNSMEQTQAQFHRTVTYAQFHETDVCAIPWNSDVCTIPWNRCMHNSMEQMYAQFHRTDVCAIPHNIRIRSYIEHSYSQFSKTDVCAIL